MINIKTKCMYLVFHFCVLASLMLDAFFVFLTSKLYFNGIRLDYKLNVQKNQFFEILILHK